MNIIEFISQPWHWAVGGVFVGLVVPLLLFLGNKAFGISSSLRHVCAACIPADIPFFKYNWREHAWNLFFVVGIIIGGFLAAYFLRDPNAVVIAPELAATLAADGVTDYTNLVPTQIFNWENLLSLQGLFFVVVGGFMVGFGTRYAGGCTSGHAISGLSNLQWPSLVATICFMVGGFISANLLVPFLLNL